MAKLSFNLFCVIAVSVLKPEDTHLGIFEPDLLTWDFLLLSFTTFLLYIVKHSKPRDNLGFFSSNLCIKLKFALILSLLQKVPTERQHGKEGGLVVLALISTVRTAGHRPKPQVNSLEFLPGKL